MSARSRLEPVASISAAGCLALVLWGAGVFSMPPAIGLPLAFVLLTLVPGHLLSRALRARRWPLLSEWPLDAGVGLALSLLAATITFRARLSIDALPVMVGGAGLAAFVALLLWPSPLPRTGRRRLSLATLSLLIPALAGVALVLVQSVRTGDDLPLGADTWSYLRWVALFEQDRLEIQDPYVRGDDVEARLQFPGWLVLQASLSRLGNLDPLETYTRFLPYPLVLLAFGGAYAQARALFSRRGEDTEPQSGAASPSVPEPVPVSASSQPGPLPPQARTAVLATREAVSAAVLPTPRLANAGSTAFATCAGLAAIALTVLFFGSTVSLDGGGFLFMTRLAEDKFFLWFVLVPIGFTLALRFWDHGVGTQSPLSPSEAARVRGRRFPLSLWERARMRGRRDTATLEGTPSLSTPAAAAGDGTMDGRSTLSTMPHWGMLAAAGLLVIAITVTHPLGLFQVAIYFGGFAFLELLMLRGRGRLLRAACLGALVLVCLAVPILQRSAVSESRLSVERRLEQQSPLDLRRLWVLSVDRELFMSSPRLLLNPLTLAGLALVIPLAFRARRSRPARFAVAATVLPLLLVFTPVTAPLTARVVSVGMLWRLLWLIPMTTALIAAAVEFGPGVLRRMPRWKPGSLGYAPAAGIAILALALLPRLAQGSERLNRLKGALVAPAEMALLENLPALIAPGSGVLTPPANLEIGRAGDMAYRLSAVIPGIHGLTYRGRVIGEDAHKRTATFYHGPLLTPGKLRLLATYNISYVIFFDTDSAVQLARRSPALFIPIYGDGTYDVFRVERGELERALERWERWQQRRKNR